MPLLDDHRRLHGTRRRGVVPLAIGLLAGLLALPLVSMINGLHAQIPAQPSHHIVFQVSSNDPAAMQHALGSADNAIKAYRSRGEAVGVEIVANGGGVHMFRADTTPVGTALRYIHDTYPDMVFSVCGNTKAIMEAAEGHPLTFVEGARIVAAGIVRVVELQEQGYAYVKP